jgi:hypothetical protein
MGKRKGARGKRGKEKGTREKEKGRGKGGQADDALHAERQEERTGTARIYSFPPLSSELCPCQPSGRQETAHIIFEQTTHRQRC